MTRYPLWLIAYYPHGFHTDVNGWYVVQADTSAIILGPYETHNAACEAADRYSRRLAQEGLVQ